MHGNDTTTPATAGVERPRLRIGFIPLTDCAPLVVASEHGLFAAEGLDVTLVRESSWATLRDKVAYGELDGAQMLAGMPLSMTLGLGPLQSPTVTALALGLNGNAITVSAELYRELSEVDLPGLCEAPVSARPLARLLARRRQDGLPPPVFAMVYPVSTHNYQLRFWLAAAGIDPDRDLALRVVPPPQMVEQLRRGTIDGYCVGEPWNSVAVAQGHGRILVSGYEIWNNSPEKVFGVSLAWAERHPRTHRALLRALLRATQWLDTGAGRATVAGLLADDRYVGVDALLLHQALNGRLRYGPGEQVVELPDFHVFSRYAANYPWRSHAVWLLTQMVRWGQLRDAVDLHAVAAAVYRPELFREVTAELGWACPGGDFKHEGEHAGVWGAEPPALGADRFCDGSVFDPMTPSVYVAAQPVRRADDALLRRLAASQRLSAPGGSVSPCC